MLLPGPEAQPLATYLGWLTHRTLCSRACSGGLLVVFVPSALPCARSADEAELNGPFGQGSGAIP
ncbi:hypothetical protein ACTZWW_14655 [Salinarimonas sp. NSM]|uniref:hypothetical protein n=1 Tax=Salinarimonas sp. NSM TaxID=3458003 RepID=UPI00403577E8